MNSYVNQIEDRDWDNSANGKAFFFPVWNFTHTIAFMSNAFCFTFSSIFLYLDDAFIGGEHKVGVSTYLWEEESPDAWYSQQFEDSYFHTLDDWNNYNVEDWGGMLSYSYVWYAWYGQQNISIGHLVYLLQPSNSTFE